MDLLNELKDLLFEDTLKSWEAFNVELRTDENKDYRRGFLGGMLCARLQMKSDIADLQDATEKKEG